MSTEVEQQQPTVAPVADKPVEENGNGVPATTETTAIITTTNGETKTEEKKNGAVKKEPEPPKDPKTETAEWVDQQNKTVIHKANYHVLNWAINETFAEDDAAKPVLPKSGFVTRNEFLNYLKDGVILGRFANKFQPGAAEAVKEGEEAKTKENQEANIKVFETVAKQHVPEDQVFTHEDLEKGKESYVKVFSTLFQLTTKATSDQFKNPGGDFDKFLGDIAAAVPQKFWQKLLTNLKNAGENIQSLVRRPFNRTNSTTQAEQTEQTEQNGATTNGVNGTETAHEENGAVNGTKVEEKKEEAPAVAAN